MGKLLVVDDDPHIRELVSACLAPLRLDVVEAANGRAALEVAAACKVELVVLDAMMPVQDGWDTCREFKRLHSAPVLMLTARGLTADKVRGFELGADDYVVKPFDPQELLARAKSLLGRYKADAALSVQAGGLVLDKRRYEVRWQGGQATIPPKEFELLFKLAASPGITFTRDQLLDAVWGSDFAGVDRTVDVHINRIRERFPEAVHGYRITTIRGLGYRFEAVP